MNERPAVQPGYESAHYYLRGLTASDANERFLSWYSDPEVLRYLRVGPREPTPEALVRFIAAYDRPGSVLLGIFDKRNDRLVGHTSATCDLRNRVAGLSVTIGERDYWGSGVVPETRAVFLDLLFGPGQMEKAKGEVYARNIPALFNYKSLGFRVEGTLRSHAVLGGERVDLVLFGLLKGEWLARRQEMAS